QRSRQAPKPRVSEKMADWQPPPEQDDDVPILPGFTEAAAVAADEPEPITIKRADKREERTPEPDEPGFSRIFLNVGRRDGARAPDLQKILTDVAGIARNDTGRIR